MQAFLAVTNQTEYRSRKGGDEAFWCVYRNYNAAIGDLVVLYKTGTGIVHIYSIDRSPTTDGARECVFRGLLTVFMRLRIVLDDPVTAKSLRAHKILKDMGAVRRNFQATVFRIGDDHLEPLLKLVAKQNPDRSVEILNLLAPQ